MRLWGWWRRPACEHPYVFTVDGVCMGCHEFVGIGFAEVRAMTNPPPLSGFGARVRAGEEERDGQPTMGR